MADDKYNLPFTDAGNITRIMQGIASDLWGAPLPEIPGGARRTGTDTASKDDKPETESAKETVGFIPSAGIWTTADEPVDWTEALGRTSSADGMTPQKTWAFYHRMAEKVLQGDVSAYVEVLTTVNPLGDLTGYANGISMRAPDGDRLEAGFEALPEYLEREGNTYLCGLSLRIARDLFAILPVSEVTVEGTLNGERKIRSIWTRKQMAGRNFRFLDPVEFACECGAEIID